MQYLVKIQDKKILGRWQCFYYRIWHHSELTSRKNLAGELTKSGE